MFEFEIRKGFDDSLVDFLGLQTFKLACKWVPENNLLKAMSLGHCVLMGAHEVTDNYLVVNYYPVCF